MNYYFHPMVLDRQTLPVARSFGHLGVAQMGGPRVLSRSRLSCIPPDMPRVMTLIQVITAGYDIDSGYLIGQSTFH